jgi:hypothetical protein
MPDIFVFKSKTIGVVEINHKDHPGRDHNNISIDRVSARPVFPDRYIRELVVIERYNKYY